MAIGVAFVSEVGGKGGQGGQRGQRFEPLGFHMISPSKFFVPWIQDGLTFFNMVMNHVIRNNNEQKSLLGLWPCGLYRLYLMSWQFLHRKIPNASHVNPWDLDPGDGNGWIWTHELSALPLSWKFVEWRVSSWAKTECIPVQRGFNIHWINFIIPV